LETFNISKRGDEDFTPLRGRFGRVYSRSKKWCAAVLWFQLYFILVALVVISFMWAFSITSVIS